MNKIKKIVDVIKEPIGNILYGKDLYFKIKDSMLYEEKQLREDRIKDLKKEAKKLRTEIRRENNEQKKKELKQRLCEVNKIIKKLQEELLMCKEKIMTSYISIPLSPVLAPLLTTHDRYSVIEDIVSIDKSKVKICDVLQSKDIEENHDKYSK